MSSTFADYKRIKKNRIDSLYAVHPEMSALPIYSYRRWKAAALMAFAPIIVIAAKRLGIKPNTITQLYIFSAIFGCFLMFGYSEAAVITVTCIFIFRQFLDWADGLLARELGTASKLGHALDVFGGRTGWEALWMAATIFSYMHTGNPTFLGVGMMLFFVLYLTEALYLGTAPLREEEVKKSTEKTSNESNMKKNSWLKNLIRGLLSVNARSIDSVAVLFVVDFYMKTNIVPVLLVLYTVVVVLYFFRTFRKNIKTYA